MPKKTVLTLSFMAAATAAVTALVLITTGDDTQQDADRTRQFVHQSTSAESSTPRTEGQPTKPTPDVLSVPTQAREDPRALGRWVANVAFGLDHRKDRAAYADALRSVTLGGDADNEDAVRDALVDDPALARMVELVPDTQAWTRMADHDQRSDFEVREPIGAQDVELGPELSAASVSTTMVLVTGIQTIHYTGEDGSAQTETLHPSLEILIGCAHRWDGCRLLRVVDRQP